MFCALSDEGSAPPPRIRQCFIFLFLCFWGLISAGFSAAADSTSSQVQKDHPVEVFLERTKGGNSQFYIPESANLLVGSLGDQNWEVLSYDRPELVSVLRHNAPDFIFTNSDLGAVLQRYLHYKHLLSFKNRVSTDAGKLSGSLIVISKNSNIQISGTPVVVKHFRIKFFFSLAKQDLFPYFFWLSRYLVRG